MFEGAVGGLQAVFDLLGCLGECRAGGLVLFGSLCPSALQFAADCLGHLLHGLGPVGKPLRVRRPLCSVGFGHGGLQRGDQCFGLLCKGLGGGLQLPVHLLCCALQGLAHLLLLGQGVGACTLPFSGEVAGHVLHGVLPALQSPLVHLRLGGLLLCGGCVQGVHQGFRAVVKSLRECLQCALELGCQCALRVRLLVERLGPGVGHLACGALPLRAEVLQLLTGVFSQPLVGALGLLC